MHLLKIYPQIILIICFIITPKAWGQVCSNQEVIPPFLSESMAANVLLLIDNSASMYDLAYDDIEEPGFCNDNSYISEGTIAQDVWDVFLNTYTFKAGSFVHVRDWNATDEAWQKTWYKATTDVTGGSRPDGSAPWSSAEWVSGTDYSAGSIVVVQKRFVQDDQSVSYAYSWYKAIDAAPAGTDPETDLNVWRKIPSIYGGYFESQQWYQWDDSKQLFVQMDPQPTSSATACTAAASQERNKNDDLCEVIQPSGFSYTLINFAAKGNYLNWLVSSKLDVEKKVLTGGKYASGAPDNYLIKESRGCLGRRMIKQVPVVNDANEPKILTMAVAQGEESSSGDGASLADCITSCTPADPTCVNDCNSTCTSSCQDQTCLVGCTATLNSCYDNCEITANNANQLTRCKDDCDIAYTSCEIACPAPDPTCITDCESDCSTNCTTQCENECTSSWANVGLAKEISRIQFFPPTDTGFQFANSACEAAIAATQFGQVQNLSEDCLEIGKQNESFTNSNAAFNHGFQTCWGYPTVGDGDITRMINACKNVYLEGVHPTDIESTDSGYVCMGDNSDDSGYIGRCLTGWTLDGTGTCSYTTCTDSSDVGLDERCFEGVVYACPTGYIWEDSLNVCIDDAPDSSIQSPRVLQFTGDCDIIWEADYATNLDDNDLASLSPDEGCIEWAIRDYCGELYNPAVPDAERPVESIADEHFPNLPAILIDVATNAQLGDPFKTVPALVETEQTPTGLLQDTTGDLRIGAMTFNSRGTAWEMKDPAADSDVTEREALYGCNPDDPTCTNRDGAIIIDYITEGSDTDALVKSINAIKATSWTPMAEAMYNAIGYYTRDTRLTPADFYKVGDTVNLWQSGEDYSLGSLVKDAAGDIYWAVTDSDSPSSGNAGDLANGSDTEVEWELLSISGDTDSVLDPVKAYCQSNNILVLTDGASTADWSQVVRDFAIANSDGDTDIVDQCSRFYGSTYVDDIADYAQSGTNIYPTEQFVPLYGAEATKENIQTYVVTTGALRTDGTEDECRADVLLNETADQGGTDQFYPGEDVTQLQEQLTEIFLGLRTRASAGSAASVISASRGGEGAVYQAIFWPEQTTINAATGEERTVAWVGEVHGLFIDANGFMFEDTDGDRTMNPSEDINGNGVCDNEDVNGNNILDSEDTNCNGVLDNGEVDLDGNGAITTEDLNGNCRLDREDIDNDGCEIVGRDRRVMIYYDTIDKTSRGCYNIESFFINSADPTFNGPFLCDGTVDLDAVQYIWSAKDWLNQVPELSSETDATENRGYNEGKHQRYIFTWNDLNNDGVVNYNSGYGLPDSEVFPFEAGAKTWDLDLMTSLVPAPAKARGPVVNDFNPPVPTNDEVDKIINWVRGVDDQAGMRKRKLYLPGGTDFTWKLGDIIHSTPMTVAAPAEGYQFIYHDTSYATFAAKYNKRRNVIYFGSNDGMLHAVNGGFYDTVNKKFCLEALQADGTCPASEAPANGSAGSPPPLGAELWAYVPYNLQPHLQCLTQDDYKHKYMVDLRPRIFDAQIFFESDGVTSIDQDRYPHGWGTILVGGMRLGGVNVDASSDLTTSDVNDTRHFISSYFIFDITDPEVSPTLLGEFTQTSSAGVFDYVDLGHSTVIPTMSIMKDTNNTPATYTDDTSKWYLVFGSGPHGPDAMKGVSDQNAKIAVLPLDGLVTDQHGVSGTEAIRPLRISPALPQAPIVPGEIDGGTYVLGNSPNGFVSDPITIDFDIAPSAADYKSDTIYFGTVEGNFAVHPTTLQSYWQGGGKMYRLLMRETSYAGHPQAHGRTVEQLETTPDQWSTNIFLEPFEDLDQNGVKNGIENGQPITASASVGYDGHNFWVYFGTGRFFDADDKTDQTQQSYYGIKEPMQWIIKADNGEHTREFTWDTVELASSGIMGNPAGSKGLLKVDEILVPLSASETDALLLCRDTATGEIRGGLATPDLGCLPNEIIIDPGTPVERAYFGHSSEPNLIDYTAGFEDVHDSNNMLNIDECVADAYQNCVDGWYKDFWPYQNRERNVGQATLLGGLVTFTTYQPFADPCKAEGIAYLYGLYYQTGTPWYEDVLGTFSKSGRRLVSDQLILGQGMATTPNLHVGSGGDQDGEGPKAFVQTSTGAIKEIKQENLPIDTFRTGRSKWKEYRTD